MTTPEVQQTLAKAAGFSGTSLHTGEKVSLKLQPAPVDHGIKFKRKDLQDEPTIDAKIDNLKTVERATTIVEMDANEPPIGDGSAQPYVDVIKRAGLTPQEAPRKFLDLREPVHVESK